MNIISRTKLITAGAVLLTLGVSATAHADGAGDNFSQLSSGINPTLLPDVGDDAKAGGLYTQVVTLDQDNNNQCEAGPTCFPPIPAEAAEVVEIDFPAEMTYKVNNKLPTCDINDIDEEGTDGAAVACADSYIGSGHAFARIPGLPFANNETELTVLAFNGATSTAGGGFDGGNPTIYLHADNALVPGPTVVGEIRNSPNAGFGKQLNVPDAPDVAEDDGALVQFGAQVAKKWNNGKQRDKRKVYNLVSANCDGGGDGDLDFGASWTYDDASEDTDTYSQDCTVLP